MAKKEVQTDLEELIAASNDKFARPKLIDPFLGVEFTGKARNHYEVNDGVPVAPAVSIARPTIRQRIEHLTNRNPEILQEYLYGLRSEVPDEGNLDLDIPDDPEAPLTDSEANFIDHVAGNLAENAPLPDDGLPRPEVPPSKAPDAPGGGSSGATPAEKPVENPAGAVSAPKSVPTR